MSEALSVAGRGGDGSLCEALSIAGRAGESSLSSARGVCTFAVELLPKEPEITVMLKTTRVDLASGGLGATRLSR